MTPEKLFHELLGLGLNWEVSESRFEPASGTVYLTIQETGRLWDQVRCPQDGGLVKSLSGVTGNSVIYEWDLNSGTTSADVSYTSPNAPTFATFTLNDDGVEWGSPDAIPAPAPVPEASTLLAGVMMILPFGVGVFRALRKDRGF